MKILPFTSERNRTPRERHVTELFPAPTLELVSEAEFDAMLYERDQQHVTSAIREKLTRLQFITAELVDLNSDTEYLLSSQELNAATIQHLRAAVSTSTSIALVELSRHLRAAIDASRGPVPA